MLVAGVFSLLLVGLFLGFVVVFGLGVVFYVGFAGCFRLVFIFG